MKGTITAVTHFFVFRDNDWNQGQTSLMPAFCAGIQDRIVPSRLIVLLVSFCLHCMFKLKSIIPDTSAITHWRYWEFARHFYSQHSFWALIADERAITSPPKHVCKYNAFLATLLFHNLMVLTYAFTWMHGEKSFSQTCTINLAMYRCLCFGLLFEQFN